MCRLRSDRCNALRERNLWAGPGSCRRADDLRRRRGRRCLPKTISSGRLRIPASTRDNREMGAGDFDLTMGELRAVVRFAADCAQGVLPDFEAAAPNDSRPRDAIDAARRLSTALHAQTCNEPPPSHHTAPPRVSLRRPPSSQRWPAATPRRPLTSTRSRKHRKSDIFSMPLPAPRGLPN